MTIFFGDERDSEDSIGSVDKWQPTKSGNQLAPNPKMAPPI